MNDFSDIFDLRSSNYEPGYTILCWLISRISNSVFVFLAITSFFSLVGPFSLAKRYSVWPCVSIMIYIMLGLYTNTYNNVRQSIAISIIMFSVPYIIKQNPIKFLLVVALAGSVHTSAFMFLFAYVLRYIPISFKSFLIFLASGFVISSISGLLIVQYFGTLFLSKYEELYIDGHGQTLMIIYVVITLCALYTYKTNLSRINYNSQAIQLFLRFMLVASIIQMFSGFFFSVVRLTYYFFIPIIVLLPGIVSILRNKSIRIVVCFIVFIALLYYMTTVYSRIPEINSNSQGVIPYNFCF